ncbi:unnamed protein product [Lathyrus sativus]|nr:unnamed protein product [Lathyrus sativus]
MLMKDRIDSRI